MKKAFLQPLWEKLYIISLKGMNIGGGFDSSTSGETWVMKYLVKKLPREKQAIIFDVGANQGNYTKQLLSLWGNRANIYCFEPSKKTFEILYNRLEQYKNIELYNFGFGEREESVSLYFESEGSILASVYKRQLDHLGFSMNYEEKVRLRTIDNFCRDAGIEHIDFLKLDVEGHELKVLTGAKNLISSNSIDFIQFEFGGCNLDSRTYFNDFFYLLNGKYKIFRVIPDGLFTIEQYKETHEIFTTTNFLAILRSKL